MKTTYIFTVCLLFFTKGFSQHAVLCPSQEFYIAIENSINIPTITNNGDGTLTLTHPEQYITDIFSNYIISDFYQTFPHSSGALQKYYTILIDSKDLINELISSVPSDIFSIDAPIESTPINSSLINFLDGKHFRLTNYCGIADYYGKPCPEQTVPNDVNITVSFNYDNINNLLLMNSYGSTTCGNSFSIALKGGTNPNTLQLWESSLGTSNETNYEDPCHNIENGLYSILDIACNNFNYGDITPTIDTENKTLFLFRNNVVFGYNTVTFTQTYLSIKDSILEQLKVYEVNGNPFLQLSTSQSEPLFIEIYSITGSKTLEKTLFKPNEILIDELSIGLYFVKVSNKNNQYKILKFLKR